MATESNEKTYSCEYCDDEFEGKEDLHEHMRETHDETPDEKSEESAAAGTDASGSTGSITEENNESPSAAEPSEAAGPSGNEDEIGPDSDD
ncbi:MULTISPECIES: C2H2-type zinc finger protein [unclassified Haladaptatus]|uniref:C2H2-type zinc finger protein n=1 Tax=unclassified Haladaptatus TaxID=2622732 RepID=UPI00209C46B7|nr:MULTISPECIES: C2H2-type zinc finger protein [unclassified Haladaptatus]MCO8245509.1 hypothetical protein [Haladaptatus sp. AB643]MCO8255334.1 hypothetical protein [Haladaptatus sp. AB618]